MIICIQSIQKGHTKRASNFNLILRRNSYQKVMIKLLLENLEFLKKEKICIMEIKYIYFELLVKWLSTLGAFCVFTKVVKSHLVFVKSFTVSCWDRQTLVCIIIVFPKYLKYLVDLCNCNRMMKFTFPL